MKKAALVVTDLQNDITKNYRKIIEQVNSAVRWALSEDMHVVYIRHFNLSEKTRTFRPGSRGSELVPELLQVSENIFDKTRSSALTCGDFADFIKRNGIEEFYITGADAAACVKSTSFNLAKAGYKVCVISDCITSYDLKKMDELMAYYAAKGCQVMPLEDCMKKKEDMK